MEFRFRKACSLLALTASAALSSAAFGQSTQSALHLSVAPEDLETPRTAVFLDDSPMINPADERRRQAAPSTQPSEPGHVAPFELAPVTVMGEKTSPLREEDRVGPYAQPRWTADRRFPGVRTYVMPQDSVEFEYWTRADVPRKGPTELQHMFELEFGLPYRFQLDLYVIDRTEGGEQSFIDQQIEVRWAFADWGKIWGNPTLYLEYINRDELSDKIEFKLLLSGELGNGWHWGQNFLFEGETGGEREYEYGWTGGISYTVIDEKLSIGAEAQFSLFDVHGNRGTYRDETFVGPSVQFRPAPRIHMDLAPLIGVDHETGAAKLFFVFGYEF
jgi:hypothetical protein